MRETGFQNCPILGVGLGLRREFYPEILQADLDWLEFTPENYIERGGYHRKILTETAKRFPLVSHGVSLSLGSMDPLNTDYLSNLRTLFEEINPPWFSDHLCFSSLNGQYFNDLLPLPRSYQAVSHVVSRIQQLQDFFQRPFLIENISQYIQYPDDELSESDFLTHILEQADCGLLLDVNNVYVNTRNHGGDPMAFVGNLPLHRVIQIHVAGHLEMADWLVDTHGDSVCDSVWALLEWTLERTRPCGVMIERDMNMPALSDLKPEIGRLREIWQRTQVRDMLHA